MDLLHDDAIADLPKVEYAGPASKDPLSFRWYDPDRLVEGRPMHEHLPFAACFWHVMRNTLGDPFGRGTALVPWDDGTDSLDNAERRARVFFALLQRLGIRWYCFHDHDVAPEGDSVASQRAAMEHMTGVLDDLQTQTGIGLLWGTACLFAHPRYAHGAATSPDVQVFAHGAGQVRRAIDATQALGGRGYVFWGGREGYSTLLNTDVARERAQYARLLHLAIEHADTTGFEGTFYIEPKPREPSLHQYDSDVEATLNFLREFGLEDRISLNIETNHATLAGKSMGHELRMAAAAGMLGSIDANMGDAHAGWDTDRFPTDLYLTTDIMLVLLEHGGLETGGLNFDAKRRRESMEPIDLLHAHIAGMDTFARGLLVAAAIREDGRLSDFMHDRYASWESDLGQGIMAGTVSLRDLESQAAQSEPTPRSGRQEMLEAIVNDILLSAT
ncbi:MAG: xylose isomerase [Phycisphaerales bacterium]|nr:xylose isomerase [Phycisphaerales bacterium]